MTVSPRGGTPTRGRRHGKDMLKMLHQVQADLLVKNELVGQLEKTEDEYAQLKSSYEDQLNELQEHLLELQRERDLALRKAGKKPVPTATVTTTAAVGGGLREARQVDEVRRLYELKLKKLTTENQELKRKYTQMNHTLQAAHTKAEAYVSKLRAEIETLKREKKQLQKSVKTQTDKNREAASQYERQIQIFKRKEATLNEAIKKEKEAVEAREQMLKKRSEELAAVTAQMRQLTFNLRKAASEGVFLNEASLEKIMQRTTTTKFPMSKKLEEA